MNVPKVDELVHFAATLEKQQLTTLAGRATFRVHALSKGIEIIPDSTGRPRVIPRERLARVLAEFDKTGSLQPGHYQSITFDASYLLTLLKRYLDDRETSKQAAQGADRLADP